LIERRTILGLPLVALAACTRKAPPDNIHVLAGPYYHLGGLYLAQERGYFKEENLNVTISQSDGGRAMIPQLAEGQADVGFSGSSPALINAFVRGAQYKIVAGRGMYSKSCPDNRLVFGSRAAFPDGFTHLSQMRGKRIAYGGGVWLSAFVWDRALEASGLKSSDVTLIEVEDQEAAVLVAAGKLDVTFNSGDEIRFSALWDEVVHGPSFSDFLPDFMYSYVYYGKRLLTGSADRGIRLLRAFLRGQKEFVAGASPQYLINFARQNKMNEQQLLSLCRQMFEPEGRIHTQDLQTCIDWAVKRGFCQKRIMAEEFIDPRFIDGQHA
jgi:NitT/TauT family transport system substrate-binding protein